MRTWTYAPQLAVTAARLELRLPLGDDYHIMESDLPGLIEKAGCFHVAIKGIIRRYPERHARPSEMAYLMEAIIEMVENDLCVLWRQTVDRKVRLRAHAPSLTDVRRRL